MLLRSLTIAALLGALAVAGGERALGQTAPVLSIDPPAQTVAVEGGAFEVRFLVDNVTNTQGLGGYTLLLGYDPSIVHALSVTDSGYVANTGNASLCPSSAIDNESGDLGLFCFTIPLLAEPGPQTSEPRVLTRVVFEAVATGTTVLDVSGSSAIDPQGNDLGATGVGGRVTVSTTGVAPEANDGPGGAPNSTVANRQPAQGTGDSSLPTLGAGPGPQPAGTRALIAAGLAASGFALASTGLLIERRRRG